MKPSMKTSRVRLFGAALVVASAFVALTALAQQPNPNQGLPAGHPPLDLPPGQRPQIVQPGQPNRFPGQPGGQFAQPGQRPGLPPGFRPQPRRAEPEPEHAGGGHGEAHCPGHGPDDAPHVDQINWWHGMIAVNNEKAQAGGFLNQLLWRYENHGNACDPKNEPPPFLASLFNLGVLGFVLYRFGRKPVAAALVKRKQSITSEIETAAELERKAKARLAEYEQKLKGLKDTLSVIRAEYAAQAELEKKHVIAEAEERRARMKRDAEFRIDQELRTARIELMHEAVESATVAAEEIIRKRAAQADMDRMSEEYLASVRAALSPNVRRSGGAQQ